MSTPAAPDSTRSGSHTLMLSIFWIIVVVFALLLAFIFLQNSIPNSNVLFEFIFFPGIALLFVLGVILIVIAARARIGRGIKWSLVLTGIAAAGTPASAVLHNLVYGLMIAWFGEGFWERFNGGDEALFFALALFVFPCLFIISAICAAVILARSRGKIQL